MPRPPRSSASASRRGEPAAERGKAQPGLEQQAGASHEGRSASAGAGPLLRFRSHPARIRPSPADGPLPDPGSGTHTVLTGPALPTRCGCGARHPPRPRVPPFQDCRREPPSPGRQAASVRASARVRIRLRPGGAERSGSPNRWVEPARKPRRATAPRRPGIRPCSAGSQEVGPRRAAIRQAGRTALTGAHGRDRRTGSRPAGPAPPDSGGAHGRKPGPAALHSGAAHGGCAACTGPRSGTVPACAVGTAAEPAPGDVMAFTASGVARHTLRTADRGTRAGFCSIGSTPRGACQGPAQQDRCSPNTSGACWAGGVHRERRPGAPIARPTKESGRVFLSTKENPARGVPGRSAAGQVPTQHALAAAAAPAAASAALGRGGRGPAGDGDTGQELHGVAVPGRAGGRVGRLCHGAGEFERVAAGAAGVFVTRHGPRIGSPPRRRRPGTEVADDQLGAAAPAGPRRADIAAHPAAATSPNPAGGAIAALRAPHAVPRRRHPVQRPRTRRKDSCSPPHRRGRCGRPAHGSGAASADAPYRHRRSRRRLRPPPGRTADGVTAAHRARRAALDSPDRQPPHRPAHSRRGRGTRDSRSPPATRRAGSPACPARPSPQAAAGVAAPRPPQHRTCGQQTAPPPAPPRAAAAGHRSTTTPVQTAERAPPGRFGPGTPFAEPAPPMAEPVAAPQGCRGQSTRPCHRRPHRGGTAPRPPRPPASPCTAPTGGRRADHR